MRTFISMSLCWISKMAWPALKLFIFKSSSRFKCLSIILFSVDTPDVKNAKTKILYNFIFSVSFTATK